MTILKRCQTTAAPKFTSGVKQSKVAVDSLIKKKNFSPFLSIKVGVFNHFNL
jgi:hypothetical protein